MNAKNLSAELYRIAEEAHKGVKDEDIRQLCAEVAREYRKNANDIYRMAESMYAQHFESR